jgi:hypothetical protein
MRRVLGEDFERWRDTWQRQRRLRTKAMKALHHIVHRAMSKTVRSWQKVTASNNRLRIRISRIMARLWNRTMSRGFEVWYARAQNSEHLNAKPAMAFANTRIEELEARLQAHQEEELKRVSKVFDEFLNSNQDTYSKQYQCLNKVTPCTRTRIRLRERRRVCLCVCLCLYSPLCLCVSR